jgi:hypothetical protein
VRALEEKKKELLRMAGLGKQVDLVDAGRCPTCGKEIRPGEFRDELSRREFGISGMCQMCQDEVFNQPEV